MSKLVGWLVPLMVLSFWAASAYAADGVVVRTQELLVVRHGGNYSVSLPGDAYQDFVLGDNAASLTITGAKLGSGSRRIPGRNLTRVAWEPSGDATKVTIEYSAKPSYSAVNSVQGTEVRPKVPQVLVGLGFAPEKGNGGQYPVAGGYHPGERQQGDEHGSYTLPKMPATHYSDALVTLDVRNVDFRDVLWLMSDIGNVSIILDPYWNQEPTGSRRPPLDGGTGGGGNGGGAGGGDGFRNGGQFQPNIPQEGTGYLSLNFQNVPFDQALDLILMAVGLVKVDIYPGDMS